MELPDHKYVENVVFERMVANRQCRYLLRVAKYRVKAGIENAGKGVKVLEIEKKNATRNILNSAKPPRPVSAEQRAYSRSIT